MLNPVQLLMVWPSGFDIRVSSQIRFLTLAFWTCLSASTFRLTVAEDPTLLPALYMGSDACTGEMLLFLDFFIVVFSTCGIGPMILGCTAMPLTRCDVPSPLVVSSKRSMLSQARVVKTSWWMLLGSAKPIWDRSSF